MTVKKALNVGPSAIEIAYQRLGDPAASPVFLIIGAGAQMIVWPERYGQQLSEILSLTKILLPKSEHQH